ncbi:class E sortase [Microbacterium sp. LRZ72]|uniref:class E sortase n=1 Tax=Microbacterium sp. LRZ72 TaxID=2942481 RepID=UPI0029AC5F17|nr:class E sortase [Microbacterium sp. LRZ72]MDX2376251.1 class E sortase [Microbacterium sp. LRZ72]
MDSAETGGDGPTPAAPVHETRRSRARRPRRRASIPGVIGEVLVTAGVVVLLFVVWQMGIGDALAAAKNQAEAEALSEQWSQGVEADPQEPEPLPEETPAAEPAAEPVVLPEAADGEVFGIMRIPRFGDDFAVNIGGGVSRERTLDTIGVGHYPGTQMPGEVGNFAVAAHRTGYGGAPFYQIAELHVGDPIVIETADGWYTYTFRSLDYVRPSAVEVLNPIPAVDSVGGVGERYLTMTSCSPKHTLNERIIAYSVFDSFVPREEGPPAFLAAEGDA